MTDAKKQWDCRQRRWRREVRFETEVTEMNDVMMDHPSLTLCFSRSKKKTKVHSLCSTRKLYAWDYTSWDEEWCTFALLSCNGNAWDNAWDNGWSRCENESVSKSIWKAFCSKRRTRVNGVRFEERNITATHFERVESLSISWNVWDFLYFFLFFLHCSSSLQKRHKERKKKMEVRNAFRLLATLLATLLLHFVRPSFSFVSTLFFPSWDLAYTLFSSSFLCLSLLIFLSLSIYFKLSVSRMRSLNRTLFSHISQSTFSFDFLFSCDLMMLLSQLRNES